MAMNSLHYLLFLLPLMKGDEIAEYNIVDFNQLPIIYLEQFYSGNILLTQLLVFIDHFFHPVD